MTDLILLAPCHMFWNILEALLVSLLQNVPSYPTVFIYPAFSTTLMILPKVYRVFLRVTLR